VVVIGIHTPETEEEKKVEAVKEKMKKAGLTHPIAIDNEATMWKRYSNNYWPSIYLFDKQGIARWGWSGELNWKRAKGEAHMRDKIEELLRE
jgi:hypothetical protein